MTQQINGRQILRKVQADLAYWTPALEKRGSKVAILHFAAPPENPNPMIMRRIEAAQVSTRAKLRSFRKLGVDAFDVQLPWYTDPDDVREQLQSLNQDDSVAGIIVQHPMYSPSSKQLSIIAPHKDIDTLTIRDEAPFAVPATSEAIFRVAQPYLQDQPLIAVVGAKGFVGSGVAQRLQEADAYIMEIDARDKGYGPERLLDLAQADIVITTTGQPEILDERHICPHHRLVIDCGFSPGPDGIVYGDVNRSAYDIPQLITPVPGGLGPIEMGILAERLIQQTLAPELSPWTLEPLPFQSRHEVEQQQALWAQEIYPVALSLFDRLKEQTEKEGNRGTVTGKRYSMTLAREPLTLTIRSRDQRGILCQYNAEQPPKVLANNLSGKDITAWREIQTWLTLTTPQAGHSRGPTRSQGKRIDRER